MSAPQLREEDGITFVLLDDGELDKLSVHSEGSSEFCFEEVSRGLASPVSLDDNDFVRSDSLDNLPPLEPNTTSTTPPSPQHQEQKKSNGKRRANKPKRTQQASSSEWRVVSPGIKLPQQRDPPPMPLKHNKTYTMELSAEYDIVGGEKGDANNIYFALEDTGKLHGLKEVFKTYKFVRVVADFSLKYTASPLKGNIYTTLLLKDSKTPTAGEIQGMKTDVTCMEVDMATAPHFTRSLTPRFTNKKANRALNEWLPIMPSPNATWFGIKYITDPTPSTSSLYLVSLKYTIAFRA